MKTPVHIIRPSRSHGRARPRPKPAFINGELRDRKARGIKKVLVYHFDGNGGLLVDLIPIKFVQMVQFELEG